MREQLRAHLNKLYDGYVAKHGPPVNRFKWIYPTPPPTQESHDRKVAKAEEAWRKSRGTDGGVPYRGPPVPPEHLLEEWSHKAWEPGSPPYKRRPPISTAA